MHRVGLLVLLTWPVVWSVPRATPSIPSIRRASNEWQAINETQLDVYESAAWDYDDDEIAHTGNAAVSLDPLPHTDDGYVEDMDSDLKPRAPSKCPGKAQNCGIPLAERVPCGSAGTFTSECKNVGCCWDSTTSTCYYPMDECTSDKHFVFAIRHDSGSLKVDPSKLVVPGHPSCTPVIVNSLFAIFKFSVTACGVRSYDIGDTTIYLAELQSTIQALSLKYGVISRSNPLRFAVECRYSKGGTGSDKTMASIGYMVKIPTYNLPSKVTDDGLYTVQLRLAEDDTYKTYLPDNHLPLQVLLEKPVYLELNLMARKRQAVVLVNYCLAYPRSAKNALVLLYEGCANPNDRKVSVLKMEGNAQNQTQRRFMVKAFQFMDQLTNKYLNEEIYFMCSTEVCFPSEKMCQQGCFDGKGQ